MAVSRKFSFRRLLRSFGFAGEGVAWVWRSEPNFRVHCLTSVVAVMLGIFLKVSAAEWLAISLCIGIVTSAEAFNSALEVLADATHPERHPLVGKAKDAAAGAVLLVAVAAFIVGTIIFLPKIWLLIQNQLLQNG